MDEARIDLSIAEARSLAARALEPLGYIGDEARIIAEVLLDSELCGYSHLGLARILNVAENPKTRAPRKAVSIVHETEVSAMLDGGNKVACYAFYRATELAISKAHKHGIAVVGLHNSYFSGRGAYYVEMAAKAGLVGIHFASAAPMVVPIGGTRPALGTNPIAVGVPAEPEALIFDVGTASVMLGDMILKARLGEDLPDGVAIDALGNPTRNPREALEGGALPFGGHRGYALSCCVQVMGLLAGAALAKGQVQDYGFLMIVLAPNLLLPADQFQRHVAELVERIKAMPRQAGVDEIRIPSERAFRERTQRLAAGKITVDRKIYDDLKTLSEAKEVVPRSPPWER